MLSAAGLIIVPQPTTIDLTNVSCRWEAYYASWVYSGLPPPLPPPAPPLHPPHSFDLDLLRSRALFFGFNPAVVKPTCNYWMGLNFSRLLIVLRGSPCLGCCQAGLHCIVFPLVSRVVLPVVLFPWSVFHLPGPSHPTGSSFGFCIPRPLGGYGLGCAICPPRCATSIVGLVLASGRSLAARDRQRRVNCWPPRSCLTVRRGRNPPPPPPHPPPLLPPHMATCAPLPPISADIRGLASRMGVGACGLAVRRRPRISCFPRHVMRQSCHGGGFFFVSLYFAKDARSLPVRRRAGAATDPCGAQPKRAQAVVLDLIGELAGGSGNNSTFCVTHDRTERDLSANSPPQCSPSRPPPFRWSGLPTLIPARDSIESQLECPLSRSRTFSGGGWRGGLEPPALRPPPLYPTTRSASASTCMVSARHGDLGSGMGLGGGIGGEGPASSMAAQERNLWPSDVSQHSPGGCAMHRSLGMHCPATRRSCE
ncbi:unnamed protein product [Prorocentrum cordatum]|uniref:Uncharacterized protein n=1 Tax=Prorocentrum cordatum TaxID=2364126 RepID=A0ABN9V9S2_9DINO|nr:unnamed protein product [Polarella glacialis]